MRLSGQIASADSFGAAIAPVTQPQTPTVSMTPAQAGVQITRGNNRWSQTIGQPATVTYAFRYTAPATMPADIAGFSQFNQAQIDQAIDSLLAYSDVARITFVRVSGQGTNGAYSNNASVLLANYSSGQDGAAAFAYLPSPNATGATNVSGDVWVNSTIANNVNPSTGSYGRHTLLHEIGHAIGLEHPGDYDATSGTSPTYDADAQYIEDSRQYTVMSYFASTNTGANLGQYYPAAPQLHDIYAAQRLYGANMATRTDNSVYGFNSNTNRSWLAATSDSTKLVMAVWDAGGIDTFDFSGYTANQQIDLRPLVFSNVGGFVSNVVIAGGVVIENAIGGSGNDTLQGNDSDNNLFGNAGADTLNGGAGNDRLFGGVGNDTVDGGDGWDVAVFSSAATGSATGTVRRSFSFGSGTISSAGQGTDTLANIEAATFDDDVNRLTRGDINNDLIADRIYRGTNGIYLAWILGSGGVTQSASIAGATPNAERAVGLGDVGGDGRSDLITRNLDTGVILDRPLQGNLAFSASASIATLSGDWVVVSSADFNGDGRADLLLRNANGQARIWTLSASGGVTAATDLGSPVTNDWQIVATNDLNDDGMADIVWRNADGRVLIWIMNGTAIASTLSIGSVTDDWSIEGLGDFTGDRQSDLLWRNVGTGQTVIWKLSGGGLVGSTVVSNTALSMSIAGVADTNGDGRADIIWRNYATGDVVLDRLTADLSGHLAGNPTIAAGASAGFADVPGTTVAQTSFFKSGPDALAGAFNSLAGLRTVDYGTIDSGAGADILFRSSTGGLEYWSMSGSQLIGGGPIASASLSWQMAGIGDFNGDGSVDVLWRNFDGRAALWFLGNGTITGTASPALVYSLDRRVDAIGDVDGDHTSDIIWRGSDGAVMVSRMVGGQAASDIKVGSVTLDWQIVGAGNVDGVTGDEILFRNMDGRLAWWKTNGSAVTATKSLAGATPDWAIAGIADTDGDGIDDLIWRNAGTGQVAVWKMAAGGTVASTGTLGFIGNDWQIQGTGDFNADGRGDLLWRNASGATATWLLNGTSVIGGGTIATVGLDYQTISKAPLFSA